MPGRGADRRHRHHRHSARPERRQRLRQVAAGAHGHVAEVGLRHHQHVGHLHDPGLEELERVAGAGLDDHRHGVADLLDVGLRLADADRLDHDDVEGRRQRLGGLARGGGQAAEPPARGGRADQDAVVPRVVLDPRAVAEQRAAGALRRRVHGEHGDGAPVVAPAADERGQQRRLAGAGRPGHADQVRRRLAAERRGGDLREQLRGALARPGRAVLDQVQRGRRGRAIALPQPRAERS